MGKQGKKGIKSKSKLMKENKKILLALIIFSFITPFSLFSQETTNHNLKQNGLKVGILPIANRTKLAYIDTLTSTVEDNILFTAQQLGHYGIVDGTSDKLTDPTQIIRLKRIAKSRNCHYLIAGQITQEGGAYTLTLILYDARAGKIKATQQAPFYRMIEVFDVSDRLSITLLEQLTGERIKRGTVYFVNQTPGTKFQVFVNRKKLEENSPLVTLIEGRYTIKVYNTTNRRKKVLTKKIDVKEGSPTRIVLDLSQKVVKYDKKNTIRTNVYGMMLLFYQNSSISNDSLSGGGFMIPAFSYTRLLNKNTGITVGGSLIFVPSNSSDENNTQTIGFDFKIGPYFRIGRIGLTPMLGYAMLFNTQDLTENTIIDFFNKDVESDSAELLNIVEIIMGFDFFITSKFSLYGEVGFAIGNKERVQPTPSDSPNENYLLIGFTCSIGLGLSF